MFFKQIVTTLKEKGIPTIEVATFFLHCKYFYLCGFIKFLTTKMVIELAKCDDI